MYIDFHIHAYADEIADRAVSTLEQTADVAAYTNGRVDQTREKLTEWGIDKGVLLPVATKPGQQTTINNWAIAQNHGNIVSFGTVHPYADVIEYELERIAAAGIKGVKLHPDYQGCFMFEEPMHRIYRKCQELGLIVILHMGYDPVSVQTRRAMPCDLAQVAEKYPSLILVGAHMGGMNNWERAIYYLKGADNVYLDTAFISGHMSDELFLRMITEFGDDKILFGSDLPWSKPTNEIEMINRMPIPVASKEKIFYKNAAKLLWLEEQV